MENFGTKLKKTLIIKLRIDLIICIVGGIVLIIYGTTWIGLGLLGLGPIAVSFSHEILYAFADLVETNREIRDILSQNPQKNNQELKSADTEVHEKEPSDVVHNALDQGAQETSPKDDEKKK